MIVGCCGLLYSFLIVVGSSGSFWVVYLILVLVAWFRKPFLNNVKQQKKIPP